MRKVNYLLVGITMLISVVTASADTNDPCGTTLRLTQRISRGEVRQPKATQALLATNVIDQDAQANYQAGRTVTLLPGFSAERGATFTAVVKACDCNPNSLAIAESDADRLTLSAYPNPFTEFTVIRYKLAEASPVNLSLLNEQGQVVEVLVNNEKQEAGTHEYKYRNASAATMIYLYSLRTSQGVVSKRLLKR